MSARILLSTLVVLAALVAPVALAEKTAAEGAVLVAVVHADNPAKFVDASELKNIMLGNTRTWSNNVPVVPFMRPKNTQAGKRFYKEVLGMVPNRFAYHWQAKQLSGSGVAPGLKLRPEEVIAAVAADRGAVAYLLTAEVPTDMPKAVKVVPLKL